MLKIVNFALTNNYEMDRRNFLKIGTTAVVAASLPDIKSSASANHEDIVITGPSTPGGLRVRFHGTSAAGGRQNGAGRRNSSVMLDGRILIDLNGNNIDMVPEGLVPEAVFYTHSHPDHYEPSAALKLGVKQVFVGATWYDRAVADFKAAAEEIPGNNNVIPGNNNVIPGSTRNLLPPKITPLAIGQKVTIGDITLTALPANHATADINEETLIYLVEKGGVRVLYATDTGGIMVRAARIAGIDGQTLTGKPITGLIMEATMAEEEDHRIFAHSCTGDVLRTTHSLLKSGRLTPPDGQIPTLLTHMSDHLHKDEGEIPTPLMKAWDSLEVIYNAPGATLKIGTAGGNWYDASCDGFSISETTPHVAKAPMFLCADPDGRHYVLSETQEHAGVYSFFEGKQTGFVEVGKGLSPCHIMHPEGMPYVCAANYTGGAVSVVSLDAEGKVAKLAKTFRYGSKSHCHQIKEVPATEGIAGRWLLATDLGLNKVHMYQITKAGLREADSFPCAGGPRHMEFNPEKKLLYIVTELSDQLVTFSYECSGGKPVFKEVKRLFAPDRFGGGGADIHLHPLGGFLYTSHRLIHDGVAVFRLDSAGLPEKIGFQRTGKHPRNFVITPDGMTLLVACRDTSAVEAYRVGGDGMLTKVSSTELPDHPVCLIFG